MKLETLAIHAGYSPDPTTKAVAVPIYQTSSYAFDDTQHGADLFDLKVAGNIYSRIMNPTNAVLEERVAALEGGVGALAVASGMAAITYAIQTVAEVGDNIVSVAKLYGGTYNLLAHTLPRFGIQTRFAAHDDIAALEALIDDKTKAVFCESIGNPAGNIVDLAALAAAAHRHGVPLIVDNTVATPILCRPFEHGADIVVHSLTKYIGGHGTSIGGSGGNTGAALSPFNAFLILQGLEALALRMERHCENALKVAHYLQNHPQVAWVKYAGLPDHPEHALAQRFCGGKPASILSFGIVGGQAAGARFIDALQLVVRLVNIGDAKSLACHPASTTHRQLNDEELERAGVPRDMVRLSIGIEHSDDILADLAQALDAAAG